MSVKHVEVTVIQLKSGYSNKVKRDFMKLSLEAKKAVDKVLKMTIEPIELNSKDNHKNA